MKDLEWLRKELVRREDNFVKLVENEQSVDYNSGKQVATRQAIKLIDQLDKPETLSRDWINKHKETTFDLGEDSETVFVKVDKLQNLLVPKKENLMEKYNLGESDWGDVLERYKWHVEEEGYKVIEKPVIPQFVADYIEKQKEFGYSFLLAYEIVSDSNKRREADEKLVDYIQKNQDDFVRAWYGYEIEEEPKYYAKIKGWENVSTGSECFNWVYFKEKDTVGISKAVENKYQAVSFTKEEWANLGVIDDNAEFEPVEGLD